MFRVSVGAVVLSVSMALAWSGAATAAPAPADGTRQVVQPGQVTKDPRLVAQATLVAVAQQIQQTVSRNKLSGFTGVGIDVDGQAVKLYWKGGLVPAQLHAALTVPKGVRLVTVSTPYSKEELNSEARRIAEQNPDLVVSAGPNADFSGLAVSMDEATVSRQLVAPAAVAASAGITSAIPLSFSSHARLTASSRWADRPPYWGGAAIMRPVGSGLYDFCTTGFEGKATDGHLVMITADHCGQKVEWTTGDGWIVGDSGSGYKSLDANLILNTPYEGNIYNGDYTSNTGVPIYGAGDPALDSLVFASGSWSGASVVRVQRVNQFWNLTGLGTVGPGFITINDDQVASIGQGDSGGPVAQVASVPGGYGIYAGGITSAISTGAFLGACQGLQSSGRQCSTHAFIVNISDIMFHYGLQIGVSGSV